MPKGVELSSNKVEMRSASIGLQQQEKLQSADKSDPFQTAQALGTFFTGARKIQLGPDRKRQEKVQQQKPPGQVVC